MVRLKHLLVGLAWLECMGVLQRGSLLKVSEREGGPRGREAPPRDGCYQGSEREVYSKG